MIITLYFTPVILHLFSSLSCFIIGKIIKLVCIFQLSFEAVGEHFKPNAQAQMFTQMNSNIGFL